MREIFALKIPGKIDASVFNELIRHVSSAKRERLATFSLEEHKLGGIFADLLIRSILMRETGIRNEEIAFVINNYGKPSMGCFPSGKEDFHFNLSHSGTWAVAAVDTKPVGVDVEQIGPVDFDVLMNFFSMVEQRDLMREKKSTRPSYFFSLWTLKESYLKMLGEGWTIPLNLYSIKIVNDAVTLLDTNGKPVEGTWLKRYEIHSDYKMALCSNHPGLPGKVNIVTADEVIEEFLKL